MDREGVRIHRSLTEQQHAMKKKKERKKKIAFTMGDPGGIGPEIVLKALASSAIRDRIIPVVIGVPSILEEALHLTRSEMTLKDIEVIPVTGDIYFQKGAATPGGGAISVECIRKAVHLCLNKEADAMVTAPISKTAINMANHAWPGHTEMLAELTGTEKFGMMFIGEKLKVILATIHGSLRSVPEKLTKERVYDTIGLAARGCYMLSIESPKIGVAGLNPHAGEEGLFGDEETAVISPAIAEARSEGFDVSGPVSPDVIFRKAFDGAFDIVVAMYHDQGLIPFKMLYFENGVNATVGLPIIRTSPDHGTAYDIAWKGVADPSSMVKAVLIAERMNL